MRIVLSAVLLMALCFVPAESLPEVPAYKEVTASVTVRLSEIPATFGTPEDTIIIWREVNCDPDMLIPVAPTNDPEFELAPESQEEIYVESPPAYFSPKR